MSYVFMLYFVYELIIIIRRVTSLAIPAFIASAASTLPIQDDILIDCVKSDSESFQAYMSAWSAKFGAVPDILPTKQPFWDRPGVLEDKAQVEASLAFGLRFWLLPRSTVETGCSPCPSPHAV